MTRKLPRTLFKMATRAWHVSIGWDMSMSIPDLCRVSEEDDLCFYGSWVVGMGAFNVKFPKETTRDLTEAEAEMLSQASFRMTNGLAWSYTKDELLNSIHGEGR